MGRTQIASKASTAEGPGQGDCTHISTFIAFALSHLCLPLTVAVSGLDSWVLCLTLYFFYCFHSFELSPSLFFLPDLTPLLMHTFSSPILNHEISSELSSYCFHLHLPVSMKNCSMWKAYFSFLFFLWGHPPPHWLFWSTYYFGDRPNSSSSEGARGSLKPMALASL